MPRPTRHAFTIVELLVVIAVIVVLVAMLAPAMEQAIYRAELTTCASRQHAIVGSAVSYAMSHGRRYPHRPPIWNWQAGQLIMPVGRFDPEGHDVRELLRPYLPSLNGLLNDPVAGTVDFDAAQPTSYTFSPYLLWFGWSYLYGRRMSKVGDRFTYRATPTAPEEGPYSVLVSDWDTNTNSPPSTARYNGAHPDRQGRASNFISQDRPYGPTDQAILGNPNAAETTARWSCVDVLRSDIDLNAAFEDGSVRQHKGVTAKGDLRVGEVPVTANDNTTNAYQNVPFR